MLKIGDKVEITDWSYAFGVKDGVYSTLPRKSRGKRFTVLQTNLKATGDPHQLMSNGVRATADILVTDNDGGFWFTTSWLAKKINHTITFDNGFTIEISDESYNALKNQLS